MLEDKDKTMQAAETEPRTLAGTLRQNRNSVTKTPSLGLPHHQPHGQSEWGRMPAWACHTTDHTGSRMGEDGGKGKCGGAESTVQGQRAMDHSALGLEVSWTKILLSWPSVRVT